jgi:hypothetical protein
VRETPTNERALYAVASLVGLALAVPFWVGRVVPLLDLPQHMAMVAVLRHHGEAEWGFARYLAPEWGELTPYWTHYLGTYLLSLFVSVETATRLYLSVYALLTPWAGVALARAFGRSPWLGLLAGPLSYNTNLYLGFVSYATAVPLLLFLLAGHERSFERPRLRPGLAAGAALLFFTHVQAFALLVALAAVLAATRAGLPWARRAASLWPYAPAVAALFLPWLYQQTLAPRDAAPQYAFGRLGRLGARFQSPADALRDLPGALAGSFQDRSDLGLLAVWAVLLAMALFGGDVSRSGSARGRALLPALLSLLAYFVLPVSVTGQWNIAQRFAWLAALLAIAGAAAAGRPAVVVGGLAAALSVAVSLNAARQHVRFDREAGAFDRAIDAIPRGARVLPLIFENRGAVLAKWPYLHLGQLAMVRRGGVVSSTLARVGPFPVRLLDPKSLPALDAFYPEHFRYERHGAFYDCFLARGAPPRELFPEGAVRTVFREGAWRTDCKLPEATGSLAD